MRTYGSPMLISAQVVIQLLHSLCVIYVGQSGSGAIISWSTSVSPACFISQIFCSHLQGHQIAWQLSAYTSVNSLGHSVDHLQVWWNGGDDKWYLAVKISSWCSNPQYQGTRSYCTADMLCCVVGNTVTEQDVCRPTWCYCNRARCVQVYLVLL
jgi:hypothetical protein